MTRSPVRLPVGARLDRWLRRRAALSSTRGDDGFILLESVVAISIITIVMAAFATFFVNSVSFTSLQRARQAASQIADANLENIRGLPASDLVTGHDTTSVNAQFAAAATAVQPWLASMTKATDSTAATNAGASANVPTVGVTQTINNVPYLVNNYLGYCAIPSDGSSTDCTASSIGNGVTYLRVVTAVTWSNSHCTNSACSFITATVLSTADDPTFNLNQSPPSAPVITNPGNQTAAVGDTVTLQLAVTSGTGVPTYTWAVSSGSLPGGLAMNPAGLISGVATTAVTNLSVTVTVTDAFLRTATATFTWTIYPTLKITQPVNQASVSSVAITGLTLTATGGSGTGYTWSDPGGTLPPGLALATVSNQGKITGSPTTPGVYTVTITVKDSSAHTATTTFTWTVANPPIAATNPGAQISTIGRADSLQLTATGGSGTYTWTGGASLPAGLTLSSGGLVSGTPTTISTKSVSLTATDTNGASVVVAFSWAVVAQPTVTSPGNQTVTASSTVSFGLTTTCPNGPCTYAINNAPGTFSVSSTGVVSGTFTSTPGTYTGVTVTVTDSAGATASTAAFTITVIGVPNAPTNVNDVDGDGQLLVSWTAPANNGSTITGYTVTLSPNDGTCSTTGATSCTITGLTNGTVYTVTVTATNGVGTGPPSTGVIAIPYPATLMSGTPMTLWLDGADPTTTLAASNCTGASAAAGATVGCWTDKSAQGEDFAQATTANRPTVNTWNSTLPSVGFADSTDVLNSINAADTYQTVFVVSKMAASTQIAYLFGQAGADFSVRVGSIVSRSAPNANDWSYNTGSTPLNWNNGIQATTSFQTPLITTDVSAAAKTFAASVSSTFLSRGVVGSVAEVITFRSTLTTAQRRVIEDYLSRKWGISITPDQPLTPTAVAGTGSATVSWTAPTYTGGTPITSYTVTSSAGQTCTTSGTSCKVTGLTRNTSYTFTVTATNVIGTSPPSAASNSVRPS